MKEQKQAKTAVTVSEYIRNKVLNLNGLIETDINPQTLAERYTFVNNINDIKKLRLKEYNVWYTGDSDNLLNFYTKNQMLDFNYEPMYDRNKRSYFWSVSSTEDDIKRTHSGQPRNIIDTLCSIVNKPNVSCSEPKANELLQDILEDNNFVHTLIQKIRPYTLVDGYGALKINWDKSISDYPILLYYRAENVDFVYRNNRIVAIIYRDYYTDERKNSYVLFETRRLGHNKDGEFGLFIEKDLFKQNNSETLTPIELTNLAQLKDVKPRLFIKNLKSFLGAPVIFFEDNSGEMYGRSIFQGRVDLFDDLDQCWSQTANAIKLSTPVENVNSLFLERSQDTGLPIMPKAYNRKFILYRGVTDADGNAGNAKPVETTQPQIDFMSYTNAATQIFLNIIQGIMSPCTFGINVSANESGAAEREKEKTTIYTRNTVCNEEMRSVKQICKDLLYAYEFMRNKEVDLSKYADVEISVKYDSFADESLEKKLQSIAGAYQAGIMSPETTVEILYGDRSDEEKAHELEYIQGKQKEEMQQQMMMEQMQAAQNDPTNPANNPVLAEQLGDTGADLGGANNNQIDQMLGGAELNNGAPEQNVPNTPETINK